MKHLCSALIFALMLVAPLANAGKLPFFKGNPVIAGAKSAVRAGMRLVTQDSVKSLELQGNRGWIVGYHNFEDATVRTQIPIPVSEGIPVDAKLVSKVQDDVFGLERTFAKSKVRDTFKIEGAEGINYRKTVHSEISNADIEGTSMIEGALVRVEMLYKDRDGIDPKTTFEVGFSFEDALGDILDQRLNESGDMLRLQTSSGQQIEIGFVPDPKTGKLVEISRSSKPIPGGMAQLQVHVRKIPVHRDTEISSEGIYIRDDEPPIDKNGVN